MIFSLQNLNYLLLDKQFVFTELDMNEIDSNYFKFDAIDTLLYGLLMIDSLHIYKYIDQEIYFLIFFFHDKESQLELTMKSSLNWMKNNNKRKKNKTKRVVGILINKFNNGLLRSVLFLLRIATMGRDYRSSSLGY